MNAATKQALCLSFFYGLTKAAGIASETDYKFYFQLNAPLAMTRLQIFMYTEFLLNFK